jgi:hypothetical protein
MIDTPNDYQEKWDRRSLIRTRPHKHLDFTQEGKFFPPQKQVLLSLPEVAALGKEVENKILAHSFCKYLNDVVVEELQIVNVACTNLIEEELVVPYPEKVKLEAHTVVLDEYYHVYVARCMLNQLYQVYPEIKNIKFSVPDTLNAVTTIKKKLSAPCQPIFEIIASCIFETAIVQELNDFRRDEEIHPSVQQYINNHVNDEARHHGFFYALLVYTWQQLPENYQQEIGSYLADFIALYLSITSEKTYNREVLKAYLKDDKQADILIDQTYQGFQLGLELPIVKHVITILKKAEILDHRFVKENFIKNNLYI